MQIQKGYTGTDSHSVSYAKSQWKLVKFHLIGTDICAKMGTVAIGIGIGTCIGIRIGSLETLLHIIIIAIFIGIGIGIGVGQWKHTMTAEYRAEWVRQPFCSLLQNNSGSKLGISG